MKNLGKEILDEINRQTSEITDEINGIYDAEADEVIKDLEMYSPEKTGKYKSEWYKERKENIWNIRNKRADLTGILENGRIIKGEVKGRRPHIEICKKISEKRLIKKLGGK